VRARPTRRDGVRATHRRHASPPHPHGPSTPPAQPRPGTEYAPCQSGWTPGRPGRSWSRTCSVASWPRQPPPGSRSGSRRTGTGRTPPSCSPSRSTPVTSPMTCSDPTGSCSSASGRCSTRGSPHWRPFDRPRPRHRPRRPHGAAVHSRGGAGREDESEPTTTTTVNRDVGQSSHPRPSPSCNGPWS
jgi:hypothetical protein